MTRFWLGVLIAMGMVVLNSHAEPPARETRTESGARVPVVVELFTSEGCSSCPPADDVLSRLVGSQPASGIQVIGLSEHVDYWDRLGWRDPFSSAQFTVRQGDYAAQVFRSRGAYTPQVVVDGQHELVGSDYYGVLAAVGVSARKPKTQIDLSIGESPGESIAVAVHVASLSATARGAADVLVGVTEDGLVSEVRRGENRGRQLQHSAVVRLMQHLGSMSPVSGPFTTTASLTRQAAWHNEHLHVFAFVQERPSRRIIGAAEIRVADTLAP